MGSERSRYGPSDAHYTAQRALERMRTSVASNVGVASINSGIPAPAQRTMAVLTLENEPKRIVVDLRHVAAYHDVAPLRIEWKADPLIAALKDEHHDPNAQFFHYLEARANGKDQLILRVHRHLQDRYYIGDVYVW